MLDPEELLLEGFDKPFGHPISLRLSHEGRTRDDAQEAQFALESVAHELAAMVVPQAQAGSDRGVIAAELLTHTLADGFQGLKTRAPSGGMNPDALAGAMVDGEEIVPTPSSVQALVASVPHISLGRLVMIWPS